MAVGMMEIVARVAIAGMLGALVGFERESTGQAAGVRTHALVALGACLFTIVGAEAFGPDADASRVAAQVVTGIGFVGAGAILRNGMSVRGLTTAATLWVSAALGLAAGAGAYAVAGIGGGAVLAFILGLRFFKPLATWGSGFVIRMDYEVGHGTLGPLLNGLQRAGARIIDLDIRDDEEQRPPIRHVEVLAVTDQDQLEGLVTTLGSRSEVREAMFEPAHDRV
ncbi:MAG: MgtC/SapB family protein [Acidimicrobiia bacterium]|jgi:putative Mg2+ transporter-C (MgtC) family protein